MKGTEGELLEAYLINPFAAPDRVSSSSSSIIKG
jgi:hypothetical protein